LAGTSLGIDHPHPQVHGNLSPQRILCINSRTYSTYSLRQLWRHEIIDTFVLLGEGVPPLRWVDFERALHFFATVFWLALHFRLGMKRRLHDVYEKKKIYHRPYRTIFFHHWRRTVAGVYWGTGGKDFSHVFCLSGGQGVGVNKRLRCLYDERFWCRGTVLFER